MIRTAILLFTSIVASLLAMAHPFALPFSGRAVSPAATPISRILGETPGDVPVSLVIENRGPSADRLLGGSTPMARSVEAHQSRLEHGVRIMLPAPEGILIPANAIRILEPESDHLMVIGLREDLIQGETFALSLHFANAGEVTTTGRVRRKVDAAGVEPLPPAISGEITISLVSAPPAPAAS